MAEEKLQVAQNDIAELINNLKEKPIIMIMNSIGDNELQRAQEEMASSLIRTDDSQVYKVPQGITVEEVDELVKQYRAALSNKDKPQGNPYEPSPQKGYA